MSRFNTGNPIDSADPRDRSDNTKNLDQALNNQNDTWTDRFGFERPTVAAAIDPTGLAQTAVEAKVAAEAARDGAFSNAEVYTTVADGLADTAAGDQFQVVDLDTDEIVRYRNDAGTAEELFRTPTSDYVQRVATADVNVYFSDAIIYDNLGGTITFPSGRALKAGAGNVVSFDPITLEAPVAIPGGAVSGLAYYYYFDFDETVDHPIKLVTGSGGLYPLQTGSIRKIGTVYLGNWNNSEYEAVRLGRGRQNIQFLHNVIPNANGDPRSELVEFYGDRRPDSLDNSPLVDAPGPFFPFDIQKAVHIDPDSGLQGNFLVYPINWAKESKPNILIAMVVHSATGVWDFGSFPGPYYYLACRNPAGNVFTVEQGELVVLEVVDANTRIYGISFYPETTPPEGEYFARLTTGVRSDSANEFYFGGFWTSLSAGLQNFTKLITLNETFWPQWHGVGYSPEPIIPAKPESGIQAIIDGANNPLHSLQVRLIGDSITWGSGASGVAESSPRGQALDDPRNNLTSRTWANLFRDYLGGLACGVLKTRTDLGEGGSVDQHLVSLPPVTPGVRYVHPDTRRSFEPVKTLRYPDQTVHGYNLDIRVSGSPNLNFNCEIEVDLVGDNIRFVYAQLIGDPALNQIEVFVDGVYQESFPFTGDVGAFGMKSPVINFPFGKHTVMIRRATTAPDESTFRFEGFEVTHKVNFWNDGIIGTNTSRWSPPDGLLVDALDEDDEVVYVQLGTNNRADSSSNARKFFRDQLSSIVQYLLDQNKKVILAASCVATEENEVSEVYFVHMNEIAATVRSVAEEYGVDFINQYAYTLQHYLDGEDILPDGLHPNDAGHRIMFDNIKQRLIGAS